jgi:hypothetical protein
MTDAVRIAMWSGPRNISTAMMRAFENRDDTVVWDEPFYACYLKATGLDHPMASEIIAAYDTDWNAVIARLTGPVPGNAPVFYQKHMTHHILAETPIDWIDRMTNCFLIRNPARVLTSYTDRRAEVTLDDLGFPQQTRIFEHVRARTGTVPPILDADDVLADPRGMLTALCEKTGIAFSEAMLSWPAGPRESDGIWARHWYASVEQSTGFTMARQSRRPVPAEHQDIVAASMPHYQALYDLRLRPSGGS